MNFLFDNIDTIINAPNGIKKLRELILQLAVQGKLVPQNPADEPASVLLEKIKAEKQKLVKEGKIKKQKELPPIREDEKPFELPDGWEWTRIRDICYDWGQKKPNIQFTYIDVTSINKEKGIISDRVQLIDANSAPSRARKIVKEGTVIYSTVRPYLLNVAIIDKDYMPEPIASTAFAIVHPFNGIYNRFVYQYFRSPQFVQYVESKMIGMAYPAINDGSFFSGLIPLPPLAEQKRIVAKVDSLMGLCDELENQQQQRRNKSVSLGKAAINALLSARNSKQFEDCWNLLTENFDKIFDTIDNVKELKAAILQLAVQGKLVEQNPADEPASVLLEKIKAEKERLIEEGKIRKPKLLEKITDKEKPFELPNSWEWCRLGDIIQVSSGNALTSHKMNQGSIPVYGGNGITGYHDTYNTDKETIVIGRVGFYCGSVHLTPKYAWITDNAFFTYYSEENIYREFLVWLLKATNLSLNDNATAQPVISGKKIYPLLIPLPPLAEQKRIVAKVDSLMALCDELETRIGAREEKSEKLIAAFVGQR